MAMDICMGQCLRCSGSCDAAAVFCDECRSRIVSASQPGSAFRVHGEEEIPIERQRTATQSIVKAPDTPLPPVLEPHPDSALQAFSRLNDAARRMAHEDAMPGRRLPHASRLTPFRDISAEIRRESTPLPKMHSNRNSRKLLDEVEQELYDEVKPEKPEQEEQPDAWPDFWPWFDSEVEEKEEEDIWANRTDPLVARHRPTSFEAALIEEEDIQRALTEGISTGQMTAVRGPQGRKSPLRTIFIALAIFAIVALTVDGVLLGVLSGRSHISSVKRSGSSGASLTLSSNIVDVASKPAKVQVQISNFTANGLVLLTHDVNESVQTISSSTGIVRANAEGSATATIVVTADWGAGYHQVFAEDMKMRVTASATLLVYTSSRSKPAHLEIASTSLDSGAGIEGTDTIKPLELQNTSLSGQISWSASSDQPWLLVSPNAGTFNQSQTIDIAVQRDAKPGNYAGTVKFFSNVDAPITVKVTMSILPIPANTPVLALSPAALTFVASDGSSPEPPYQILTISNPGSQTLTWTLAAISSTTALAQQPGMPENWLSASRTQGQIPAQSTEQIQINVQSTGLLPGAYLGSLEFSAPGAADSSQTVGVSLTVQPHCGLLTTPGFLSFTAVQGGAGASSQALSLNATASCNGASLSWAAMVSIPGSTTNWLSVSPGRGELTGTASEALTVSVNATGLAPQAQPYTGYLVFTTQTKSTQTVLVQLTVQPKPAAQAPVMSASPLNLNFSYTSGQPNSPGQVVTITNNGGGTLDWKSTAQEITTCWLCVSPSGGTIAAGKTGTLTVNVDASSLSPGTYSGLITLEGTDSSGHPASGSPQTITVNLVVQPPCTLTQPSLSSLAFTVVKDERSPAPQPALITGSGNCAWPLQIAAAVSPGAPWLPASYSGSITGNGQSFSLPILPDSSVYNAMKPGTYTAQITVTATDSTGIQAQGSGETISVTLTVEQPCAFVPLSSSNANLTFNVVQGGGGQPQIIPLSETRTCAPPITYQATPSASWITATTTADSGNGGSITVGVNTAGLTAGQTYTGQITLTATDANNNSMNNSLTINVTLVIPPPTYSVSGTVFACSGTPATCTTPLAGATVTVLSGTTTVATVTADANGLYSVSGLAAGTYTFTVSGTNSGVTYTGSQPVTVTTNVANVNLDAS